MHKGHPEGSAPMTWLALGAELAAEFAELVDARGYLRNGSGISVHRYHRQVWSQRPVDCRMCGVRFTPLDPRRLYCSKRCKDRRDASSRPRLAPEPGRSCEQCGSRYTPRTRWQRFCTAKCSVRRQIAQRSARRARARQRPCANPRCGKLVARKSGCARYCSHACGERARSRAYYYRVRRARRRDERSTASASPTCARARSGP